MRPHPETQERAEPRLPGPAGGPGPARAPAWLASLGRVLGHSLFPFAALTLILGTVLWGPWGTLVLTLLWWNLVTRVA